MNETGTQTTAAESGTTATKKLIKTTRQFTKHKFTAEDKIRIVMEGIRGDDPVTVVCRREGIHANILLQVAQGLHGGGQVAPEGRGHAWGHPR